MKKVATKKNGIYRFDGVLSEKNCKQIVSYIKKETRTNVIKDLSLTPWYEKDNIRWDEIKNDKIHKKIIEVRETITELVSKCFSDCVYPHLTDIVLWRAGRFMREHVDDGSCIIATDAQSARLKEILSHRIYTSILYLNDDFKGGHTFVNSLNGTYISKPKTGTLVFFKSSIENSHGVTQIESGIRVTLPMWFTRNFDKREVYNVR